MRGDRRQRYCSASCAALARNRRKAQAKRIRVRLGRCARCGVLADGTYCPSHTRAVAIVQRDRRERRRAAGICRLCPAPRATQTHCERHRVLHNAMMSSIRQARIASGRCRQCGEPGVRGTFCEPHRQQNNVQQAGLKRLRRWATWPRQLRNAPAPDVCSELQEPRGQRIHRLGGCGLDLGGAAAKVVRPGEQREIYESGARHPARGRRPANQVQRTVVATGELH